MLSLEVNAPVYGILEVFTRFKENVDSLGIGYLSVVSGTKCAESFKKTFINKAVEELKLCRAIIHNVVDDIFDHIPSKLHIIVEHGVNITAVCQSIISQVRYLVGEYTGATIRDVKVCVDNMTV
jgi:uncharacterized alkaline shock family protein YloU